MSDKIFDLAKKLYGTNEKSDCCFDGVITIQDKSGIYVVCKKCKKVCNDPIDSA